MSIGSSLKTSCHFFFVNFIKQSKNIIMKKALFSKILLAAAILGFSAAPAMAKNQGPSLVVTNNIVATGSTSIKTSGAPASVTVKGLSWVPVSLTVQGSLGVAGSQVSSNTNVFPGGYNANNQGSAIAGALGTGSGKVSASSGVNSVIIVSSQNR